jgi:hypothetical protein
MSRIGVPRWAISFADLALLLLAFFVLLRAGDAAQVASAARAAFAPTCSNRAKRACARPRGCR